MIYYLSKSEFIRLQKENLAFTSLHLNYYNDSLTVKISEVSILGPTAIGPTCLVEWKE